MEKGNEHQIEKAAAHQIEHAQKTDEHEILTQTERRKLQWKLDTRLLPVIWIMYFINLLDRVSIGGASPYGFRRDVGLVGNQFNIGVSLFYAFYCLSQVPSNLCLKYFGAKTWLPVTALCYGLASLGTAFIHSPGGFYAVRVILGVTESSTLPGCAYFLSTYYGREQLSLRLPFFLTASPIASGVGSLLAAVYHDIGEITPLIYGWRNIFFINSILTFGTAIIGYFMLPDRPETTKLLNDKEREYIMMRSKRLTAGVAREEQTRNDLIWRAFRNPSVYFGIVPWFAAQLVSSSITLFVPEIIQQEFGFSGNKANVWVGATFFLAAGVTLAVGALSDWTRHHGFWIVGVLATGIIGTAMFFYAEERNVRYGGVYLGNITVFAASGVNTAWVASNSAPYTTRNVSTALITSLGALGGIVGAWVYLPSEASRGYPTGAIITFTFLSFAVVTTTGHWVYCKWENRQRALGCRDYRLAGKTPDEIDLLGSLHPGFFLAT